jgi:hypothetical protein
MERHRNQVLLDEHPRLRNREVPASRVEIGELPVALDDGLDDLVDQLRIGLFVRKQCRVRAGHHEISVLPLIRPCQECDRRPER